ncbi:DedA family protein [Solibacillus sp. FSL H8-0538]|uniref:DedA family protein n=1 Tax=Solibacillus sp. FSL H8-0538 TaxID=2921400 RepID=UPI0030FB877B
MLLMDIIEFLRMLDTELYFYIKKFGVYIYFVLFAIVFSKTAFVILTFLPGDSLVFASGTLASIDKLNVAALFILYFVATTLADSNNFLVGRTMGKIADEKKLLLRFMPDQVLDRAHGFLESYDRIAITFSRFVPLMRTMTPFIAGYTGFSYWKFVRFNVVGGLIWTIVWLVSGYLLGNIRWVAENLLLTLSLISLAVFVPTVFAYVQQLMKKNR